MVAHRGSGLSALFKKTFSLHDPQTTTLRGSSIDQLSFGAILDHAADTEGTIEQVDGPMIDGVATDEVRLVPSNVVINTGLTLEVVDLSKSTHLPQSLLGYEGAVLVRKIDFSNVVIQPAERAEPSRRGSHADAEAADFRSGLLAAWRPDIVKDTYR